MRVRVVLPAVAALGALAPAAALAAPAPAGTYVAALTAPAAVDAGERATVAGRVAPGRAVDLRLERLEGAAWVPLAGLRTDARGRFRADLPLRRSTNIRAVVVDATGAVRASRRRFVALRPVVTLTVRPERYEFIAGRPVTVRARVRPAEPGATVVLEGSRGGAYRALARLTVGVGGRVAGRVTLPAGGDWRVRLTVPAAPGRRAAGAAVTRFSAFAANPHGIPAGTSHYIVQDIGETLLYYYEDGRLLRVLPVVFGKPSTPTPLGTYRVYSKTVGPGPAFGPLALWYHRGYGIHGTNQEYLLSRTWRYYSHGCTRNYNANIRWLWPRVPVGTPVVNIR